MNNRLQKALGLKFNTSKTRLIHTRLTSDAQINTAIKVGGLACHKTRFIPPFFRKMPCIKSGKWPLLHYSSFMCVLHFGVVSLLCRCSLILDTFPSVLVCNPHLFFLYRFKNFEQRYTTVAFMYAYICNYFI